MRDDAVRKRILLVLMGLGAVLLAAALLKADDAAPKAAEKAAGEAANSWLALVDRGAYAESWSAAAAAFKRAVTREQWARSAEAARGPFGRLLSRKLASAAYKTSLPGAPDGEYVVLQYDASFEHKKAATETVTPMKDPDGVWRVSGYFVR
jgi:hypothetical protein